MLKDLLHSWNPPASSNLLETRLEDDSLREGLQAPFVRVPTCEEKIELMELCAKTGIQTAVLGFPSSSETEYDHCQRMLEALAERGLALIPRFLGRATLRDLEPIVRLDDSSDVETWADFFVGISPLRRHIEGWSLDDVVERIRRAGSFLAEAGTTYSISLEDCSRTPLGDLEVVVAAALEVKPRAFVVCDTAGDCTPEGAANLILALRKMLKQHGAATELWWHGHNDQGLTLANAIAAAKAGAELISGTMLGIGERTGNTPLEQVVPFLHAQGNRHYKPELLLPYCQKLAEYTRSDIPTRTPMVGQQAFATSAGTHAAAVLKARGLGPVFEDLVFSAVPASMLGRGQDIWIGPESGKASVRHTLERLRLEATDEAVQRVLQLCKLKDSLLTDAEVRDAVVSTNGV